MSAAYVLELLLRLSSAIVFGALLGWERERSDKPAGLRTHTMVSLGSASFMLLAVQVDGAGPSAQIDPTRVIQGLVGGIGFLGAGAIIQSRGQVQGITTAASVWVAGAVGTGCGLGSYAAGAATSLLAVLVLSVFPRIGGGGSGTKSSVEPERHSNARGAEPGEADSTAPPRHPTS